MWEEPQAGRPSEGGGGCRAHVWKSTDVVVCRGRPGSVQDPVPLLDSPLGAGRAHTPALVTPRSRKLRRNRVGGTGAAWAWQPRLGPAERVLWHRATGLHPASTRMQTEVDFIVWGRAYGKYS